MRMGIGDILGINHSRNRVRDNADAIHITHWKPFAYKI